GQCQTASDKENTKGTATQDQFLADPAEIPAFPGGCPATGPGRAGSGRTDLFHHGDVCGSSI
ncbi:MAG: hypothetical protein ACK5PT_08775, partial [Cereibacter sp.]